MELKVKGHDGLVRGESGAIINTDEAELIKYRQRKIALLKERERDNEIQSIKNELKDLQAIMMELRDAVLNAAR